MKIDKFVVLRAIAKKYKITLNLNGTVTVRMSNGKIKKIGKYNSGVPAYAFEYAGKKYYFQPDHIKEYIQNGKIEYRKAKEQEEQYCMVCDYTYPKKEMRTSQICYICWKTNYHNCRRWDTLKSTYTATKKQPSVIS